MVEGARRSSVVEVLLVVRWVVGSISNGGPIEIFLIPERIHNASELLMVENRILL